MKKFRMWLADKLIGTTPYIKNVTFYQTICLDINAGVQLNGCSVHLGHDIAWKGKKDGCGFNFGFYKAAVDKKKASIK